jgi:hypothetical protein
MDKESKSVNRRGFLRTSAAVTAGFVGIGLLPQIAMSKEPPEEGINIIGPKSGYSPQIGTLVSMLDWMRMVVLRSVQKLTMEQLDFLHDAKSNTIGAMLLHLAATERYYQIHTFENKKWGTWDDSIKKQWDTPMRLGDEGRKTIIGNNLDYYLNQLGEVRESSLREFKKRDDAWLLSVDKTWGWGPTNNYCKWFHVCEHESNHNGQIKYIKGRFPGAAGGND